MHVSVELDYFRASVTRFIPIVLTIILVVLIFFVVLTFFIVLIIFTLLIFFIELRLSTLIAWQWSWVGGWVGGVGGRVEVGGSRSSFLSFL